VHTTALMASSPGWPAVLVGVAAVVVLCLWLLFRTGSMADRARSDHPDDEASRPDRDQPPTGGR
jgi:hypothetical protein